MRAFAWTACALLALCCGFPEYGFAPGETVPDAGLSTSCDESPCQNDGTCIETDGGYVCLCEEGFRGDDCEIDVDDCESDPCQNGGTCLDGVDEFTCECALGYTGDHCEVNVDDCDPNPCKNGGTCEDGVAEYECECPPGFTGKTCSGEPLATCRDVLEAEPSSASGVYPVDPDGVNNGNESLDVYCDMTTDGGGWTRVAREGVGYTGTLRFLGIEEGEPYAVANGTGNGLFGVRFAGLYEEVRIVWDGESSGSITVHPDAEVFENEVAAAIPVSAFTSTDATLRAWVDAAGGAVFCRAAQNPTVRPGDTSWAIKPANDANTMCGCSSYAWAGQGAFYGGSTNATACDAYGGGWAGVRDDGQQKGGITTFSTEIFVR